MKELSNDCLTAYIGSYQEISDLLVEKNLENKSNVVVYGEEKDYVANQDDRSEPPTSSLGSFVDYVTGYRGTWESFPEMFPDLHIERSELEEIALDQESKRNPQHPNHDITLLSLHAHVYPKWRRGKAVQELSQEAHLPSRDNTIVGLPESTRNTGRPLAEYWCLERFFEEHGPNPGSDSLYEPWKAFYETESEVAVKEHAEQQGVKLDWHQLDILYPDFKERKQRIQEFDQDWFPGEIRKARKTYDHTRQHLRDLVRT